MTNETNRLALEVAALMTGGALAEYSCSHCGQETDDPDEECEDCRTRSKEQA